MRARGVFDIGPQGRGDAGADEARGRRKGTPSRFHTYTHPQPTLRYISDAEARADMSGAWIAVENAAYGEDFSTGEPKDLTQLKLHAPFFRFPGFADTADLRGWFATNNVGIFGVDLWASDWVKMTPEEELKLILGRLEGPKEACCCSTTTRQWTAEMVPSLPRAS